MNQRERESPAAHAMDRTGARLGPFVLQRKCGQGAMGIVYAAVDLRDNRPVAIKVSPATRAGDPQRARRFAKEAEVLASLEHPAIVRHVAHGETPDGELYLAMEWLEGEDLAQRLQRGKLTRTEAVALGLRVAEALAAAHARGVVHRDIKPSNLFLRDGDPAQVTILDVGIARLMKDVVNVTATGVMVGT